MVVAEADPGGGGGGGLGVATPLSYKVPPPLLLNSPPPPPRFSYRALSDSDSRPVGWGGVPWVPGNPPACHGLVPATLL